MRISTFIDGGRSTTLQALLERHSPSVSVEIDKKHEDRWRDLFIERLDDERVPGDDELDEENFDERANNLRMRPLQFHTDELWDMIDDVASEDWAAPYVKEFEYMCCQDEVGMGIAYIIL